MDFKVVSEYKPKGDQPKAIEMLSNGLNAGKRAQTLLGVTGSGKTFTIANVIERVQSPLLFWHITRRLRHSFAANLKNFSA